MSKNKTIKIGEIDVRVDLESGFICVTDLASLRGSSNDNLKNWMGNTPSINFFEAWEREHVLQNKNLSLNDFRIAITSDVTFTVSAAKLVNKGCAGIFAKRGRYGGTYCHIDWATHFANWFDARFYVLTIKVARELSDRVYGRDASQLRFSRDLAAESYGLLSQPADAPLPDPGTKKHLPAGDFYKPVERYLHQVSADIINLALWKMTALDWRTNFPSDNPRLNMRDFATAEELLVINALQIELRVLQEDQYSPEEKRHRLRDKADELIQFFCDSPEKVDRLEKQREDRGW
jgi:hypothetical protein